MPLHCTLYRSRGRACTHLVGDVFIGRTLRVWKQNARNNARWVHKHHVYLVRINIGELAVWQGNINVNSKAVKAPGCCCCCLLQKQSLHNLLCMEPVELGLPYISLLLAIISYCTAIISLRVWGCAAAHAHPRTWRTMKRVDRLCDTTLSLTTRWFILFEWVVELAATNTAAVAYTLSLRTCI